MRRLFRYALPALSIAALLLAPHSALAAEDAIPDSPDKSTVRIGLLVEPEHFDPQSRISPLASEIVHLNVLEGLVGLNKQGIYPLLAESWQVGNSGRTYTFQLRKNVVFHDGSAFDASVATYALYNIEPFLKSRLGGKSEIRFRTSEPNLLHIELNHPSDVLLELLAQPEATITHPKSSAQIASHPVGTGPFRFEEWQPGKSIKLKQHASYYGKQAQLNTINFLFIKQEDIAQMLAEDKLDAMPYYSIQGNEKLQDDQYVLQKAGSGKKIVLLLSTKPKPMESVRIRRALSFGIDAEAINSRLFGGYGLVLKSALPPDSPFYAEQKIMNVFRPHLTQGILNDFGYNKKPFPLRIIVPPSYFAQAAAEQIAEQLAKANVAPTIEKLDWKTWITQASKGGRQPQMAVSVDGAVFDFGRFAKGGSFGGYSSPALSQIIDQIGGASDLGLKELLYEQAQKKFHSDAVILHLIEIPKVSLWRSNLAGYDPASPVGTNPLMHLHYK